jgi:hypothetical protein
MQAHLRIMNPYTFDVVFDELSYQTISTLKLPGNAIANNQTNI